MPKKPASLPYIRRTRHGRLQYYRRVPADKRHLFGNKAAFTAVLDVDPSKPTAKAAHEAWATANAEYERRLAGDIPTDTASSTPALTATPLSPRDAAGIAGEPLRQLLNAGELGQISSEQEQMLASVVLIAAQGMKQALDTGDIRAAEQAKAAITKKFVGDLLDQLHIRPDFEGMGQIQQRLFQYLQALGADAAKRGAGDYSASELEQITPPVPQSQVTYADLLEQWLLDAGGLRTETGIGVSQKRYESYQRIIQELTEITGKHYPAEVTIADARKYVNAIQAGSLAIRTKQQRIGSISNLFGIAVRYGLIESNAFGDMKIKLPKNMKEQNYRPFTKTELQLIVGELKTCRNQTRAMLVKTLLVTGARSSDISQLRHRDIKQTSAGIWYLDLVDEPDVQYPHPLKGGASDERTTPLHPWLIEQEFLSMADSSAEGYLFGDEDNSKLSSWFKRILIKLDIYEERLTVLHSLRGTWIDLMREARLPQDVRRAITGHSSRDVQDRTYGQGLEQMPDVLYKELIKIDLSWLP